MNSPAVRYHIRFATLDDTAAVIGLRHHAERWLQDAGIEQWTVRSTGERVIRAAIEAGTTFVITTGAGDIVGSLALDVADMDFWTAPEAAEPALYLYKFMIQSDRRGRGLGDVLLDWCCARAEALGGKVLRLDCWRTNTGLHRYYERRGFSPVDVRSAPGRQSGALFQRDVKVRTASDDGALVLIDDTLPFVVPDQRQRFDRYDETGEAQIWQNASDLVAGLRNQPVPSPDWIAAYDQVSRLLARRADEVRQAGGMYYRVLDGNG